MGHCKVFAWSHFKFAAYLKIYTGYINGFNDALDCVGRLEQTNQRLASLLEEQREVTDGLGLADFLFSPFKGSEIRMPLEELLNTPQMITQTTSLRQCT